MVACHHGTNLENLEESHPVSNFMDSFFTNWHDKQIYVLEILKDIFPSHSGVYSSDGYRNMVIKIFTRIGTNMLLLEIRKIFLMLVVWPKQLQFLNITLVRVTLWYQSIAVLQHQNVEIST